MKFLRNFLIIIFILSIYMKHEIILFNFPIPYFYSLISGFLLLFLNINQINIRIFSYLFYLLLSMLILTIATLDTGYNIEKIKGLLNFFFAFISGYGFFLEFKNKENTFYLKISFIILLILTFFSILELIPSLQAYSLPIRSYIYGWTETLLDLKINRESVIAFGYRPTAFASETSHLALYVFIFSIIWFLNSNNSQKNIIFLILSFFFILLIRSPINTFNFIFFAFYLFYSRDLFKPRNFLIISILIIIITFIFNYILFERISMMFSGSDNSFIIRIVRPFTFIYLSIINDPIFGVGLLNNERVLDLYYNYSNDKAFYIFAYEGKTYIMNSFACHICYFGILGSLVMGYLYHKTFKLFHVTNLNLFYVILFLISITIGTYAGSRLWGHIFIILSIFNQLNHRKKTI